MRKSFGLKSFSALLAAVVMTLSACGSDGQQSNAGGEGGAFPVTVTAANGPVTLPARPQRIVSLSPTATEMLFAIGAGPQVVAVDDQSTFPPQAPKTALSGFTPNVEAIADYSPDLVVISNDMNGLVGALGRINVPVLLEPAAKTLDDVYAQTRDLGKATGNVTAADKLASDMKQRIEGHFASAGTPGAQLTAYHEVDPTLYSSTSKSFIGQIYSRFGYENIADAADKDGSGFPQLSAEYIVKANPDVIFLADTKCCGQSLQTVAARPGFSNLKAVRTGNVVALDDDVASRWGPRVVDLVAVIADSTTKAKAA